MKTFEFIGKNIEKAIAEGLKTLNKKQEDVDIKILSEGGLFKKAKVEISFEEDEIKQENNEKKVFKTEVIFNEENKKNLEEDFVKENKKTEKNDETKLKEIKKETKTTNNFEIIEEFLKGILKQFNFEGDVKITENNDNILAVITGENSGKIIGYRGECLNAIQYLTNIIFQKNNEKTKRIFIDIQNYREKREEALKNLAERIAKKVIKTQKPYKLEPMTPNERRIIHTYLQGNEQVETSSTGVEPRRYLTVYPKGFKKD